MSEDVIGIGYKAFQSLRVWCYPELKNYLESLDRLSIFYTLSEEFALGNSASGLAQENSCANYIMVASDISPPVLIAAKLLEIITRFRFLTLEGWQSDDANESIPITYDDALELWEETRQAVHDFIAVRNLSQLEAKVMLREIPQEAQDASQITGEHQQKAAVQEKAIRDEITNLGYDPKRLPRYEPGKPGIKAAVRAEMMKKPKLFTDSSFEKAWQRLGIRYDEE